MTDQPRSAIAPVEDCGSWRGVHPAAGTPSVGAGLSILAKQGFHVYLNGHRIEAYGWWKDMPHYRPMVLEAGNAKYLKKGTNVLAAYGNVQYEKETHKPAGQMDLFIEGLKMSDLK